MRPSVGWSVSGKKSTAARCSSCRQFGERVDRPARDIGGFELIEPIRGRVAAHAFGDQRIELGDVTAAGLRIGEARIIGKLGPASEAEEIPPVPVGVGQDADMAVGGAMRTAIGREHARIAGRPHRRVEGQPAHMLGHDEGGHGFEHRHLDRLALAGALALQQRRHHRVDHGQPDRLVADQGRDKPRLAAGRLFQRDKAARALNDVVKSRPVGERAVLAVAMRRAIDQPRVDLAQPFVGKAEPRHRLRAHVVHQDVALPRASANSTSAASGVSNQGTASACCD